MYILYLYENKTLKYIFFSTLRLLFCFTCVIASCYFFLFLVCCLLKKASGDSSDTSELEMLYRLHNCPLIQFLLSTYL